MRNAIFNERKYLKQDDLNYKNRLQRQSVGTPSSFNNSSSNFFKQNKLAVS